MGSLIEGDPALRKKLSWIAAAAVTLAATLGAISLGTSPSAEALPTAPEPVAPVAGIPAPCPPTYPWPGDDAPMSEITAGLTANFGFKLAGKGWTGANQASIRILWETLDAVGCTSYVDDLQAKVHGNVGLNASRISGFAWGDWSLTRSGYVSLDFTKFRQALHSGDTGRLSRLVIHELAHVLNSDRGSNPPYWAEFRRLYAKQGRFSSYAAGSVTETFGDVVGYYVGRCADNNPYDTGKYDAYYNFVRDNVFGGREFGPEPGTKPDCSVPAAAAGTGPASWVEALAGE